VGFVVNKTALLQVFSEYFGFPYQAFHRLLHTHHHPSIIMRGWYNRPVMAPAIVDSVPLHPKKQKILKKAFNVSSSLLLFNVRCGGKVTTSVV
jgi:hypothetical protein